jgi:hypothetical protein
MGLFCRPYIEGASAVFENRKTALTGLLCIRSEMVLQEEPTATYRLKKAAALVHMKKTSMPIMAA